MRRLRLLAIACILGVGATLRAGEVTSTTPEEIFLWPDGFRPTTTTVEETLPSRGDNVTRITNVTKPEILVYRAKNAKAATPAVLVCPGGAYKILAVNIEGTEIAGWLNAIGITAVVLKYTVPQNRAAAFQDAQRAMGLLRQHTAEWNIDPGKIGTIGFSAGGHLATRVSNGFEKRTYDPIDEADKLSSRPDFSILIYPAYVGDKEYKLADEIEVTSATPTAFIVQTQDDKNYIFSSVVYNMALQKAGVPCELHLFPKGGHGYGLRPSNNAVSGWPKLCETWLEKSGILSR